MTVGHMVNFISFFALENWCETVELGVLGKASNIDQTYLIALIYNSIFKPSKSLSNVVFCLKHLTQL